MVYAAERLMRQMSDNDILFDKNRRDDVRCVMKDHGFELKAAYEAVDEYVKEPIYNFEMHSELFMYYQVGDIADHYLEIKSRLLKDENNGYGYHFSNEDFYLFMTAHEYKHFTSSGTGVRSLVDAYVFLNKFHDELDWDYLGTEFEKLGIAEFERENRELAMKVFSMETLSAEEKELLDYYVTSGIYGLADNIIKNRIKYRSNNSKSKYMMYRLFPPISFLRDSVPWVNKSKLLIPAAYIYRFFRCAAVSRKTLTKESKQLRKRI